MESDPFDEDESVRLMPIPECFICPMSQTPMEDPVMTVDGCVYERSYIEQWIRHRQQQRLKVTSPATNQELPSHRLVSLTALQKAIEAYIGHRPELRESLTTSRSFEEAAQMLQSDLLEKQAMHVGTEDELSLLRDSNEVLIGALQEAEQKGGAVRKELDIVRGRNHFLEDTLHQEKATQGHLKDRIEALELQCQELQSKLAEQQALALAKEEAKSEDKVASACARSWPRMGDDKGPRRCTLTHFLGFLVCVLSLVITVLLVHVRVVYVDQPVPWPCAAMADALSPSAMHNISALANPNQDRLREDWRQDSDAAKRADARRKKKQEERAKRREEEKSSRAGEEVMDFSLKNKAVEIDREVERRHQLAPTSHQSSASRESSASHETSSHQASVSKQEDLPNVENEVSQLRVGGEDEKTQAALVLSILATASPENQAAIVRAGAVGQLVELLKGSAPEGRGQAAVALRALAANNTYNKVAIVRAGAIPPLIRLLKEDEVEVQEVAAGALQTLAETNNQVEIAQAGAIVPLVALLKDERPGVREEAAGALVILALNADNQVAIAQVGAVPLLVDLLRDDVPEVREQAAAALRNLAAENEDNQVAIARAGAFAPLAELLQDEQPGVREEALAALKNLAGAIPSGGLPDDELVVHDAAVAAGNAIKEAAAASSPRSPANSASVSAPLSAPVARQSAS